MEKIYQGVAIQEMEAEALLQLEKRLTISLILHHSAKAV